MTAKKLDKNDKFRVHGHVDIAGLDPGQKYVVTSVYRDGSRRIYVVEPVDGGVELRINEAEIQPYIGTETYIEPLKDFIRGFYSSRGCITVI